jgi:uncharacterized damage-inducible protein DinB
MASPEMLREMFAYNYWARDRQLAVCGSLTGEQLAQPLGGSFGTLRDTLKHMLGAESAWLQRFLGSSPRSLPWLKETLSLEAIVSRWKEVEGGMLSFVAGLDSQRLAQPLTYQNFKGETWSYPLREVLLHLANHGTYHRGQVTMALRLLGADAPAVDFLVYVDEKAGRKR